MKIGNIEQLKNFESKVMKVNNSIVFHKGLVNDEIMNIGATCVETNEFCPIWYENDSALEDTDGCSFGELT